MNDHNSQWINDTCMMFKNTLKDIDTGTVRNILTLALMDCEIIKYTKAVTVYKGEPIKIGFNAITEVINNASTIDAIPVSFIQELIERGKQLIEEYRGKPDYGIIVDGLIERVVNYEVLIEKWREKNGTDVD